MKKNLSIALILALCTSLTTLSEVDIGFGVGVGGSPYYGYGPGVGFGVGVGGSPYYGYGPGVGFGLGIGIGPSYPKGAVDYKGRDYWRINNETPFHITVQSDRTTKTIRPGKRNVKLHRYGDFNFMVMGGGRQKKVGTLDHNVSLGLDEKGQIKIITSWTE